MKSSLGQGKKMIWQAIELLFGSGVMQFSGHGNISARLGEDRMVLTSKGILRTLKPDDFVTVSFDDKALEGKIDPTTAEIVTMHTGIYQVCREVGSVIHTHSSHATAFALAQQPLPCAYEALLRFGIGDVIPVAAWAPRGSKESVSNILKQIAEHPNSPAVLLANHGLLAFGANPIQAAELIIVVEETARAMLGARILGGEKSFPVDALKRVQERIAEFKTEK
jgi:L-ribulose-5-phosphate 4-epimerase